MQKFTHLNVHSGFSIIDGVMSPKEIVKKAKEMGMESVAITDYSSMYSAIEFYETAQAEGIKPILGIEVNIVPEYKHREVKSGSKTLNVLDIDDAYRAKLYARNTEGYTYLMEILSEGYMKGLYHKGRHNLPYVEEKDILERSGGLVMLSNMEDGKAGQYIIEKDSEKAKEAMMFWKNVFKDRYFTEISRTGRLVDDEYIPLAVHLSMELEIPIVATNNVRFAEYDDFYNHEIRVAIQEKENIEARGFNTPYSPHQYFKTMEQMEELFYDIPEALENSQAIADHCNVELELHKPALPKFPTPYGTTEGEYLETMAKDGLNKRLDIVLSKLNDEGEKAKTEQEYRERLDQELEVINNMGFPGYFLIVADFIQWSKRNDIPVGPGRGSGAGSLVAYSCEITDIDPMPYDLLFERFLNPERVSMPDFDIDFCIEGRDKVIDYVSQRYGNDAVSQIATFGKMAARSAIKDVVRVTGNPFSLGERLVKMIPKDLDITIEKAIARSEFFRNEYEQNAESRQIIDTAMALEGVPRSIGRHAGGVLISPSKLSDFTPVHYDGDSVASQYDKDDVETAGLVKFDFLGLKNLTVIDKAVKKINVRRKMEGKEPLDITHIPMDDNKAFNLLKEGNTTAVFQLESNGMKGVMKKLQPDDFEDIVALVALYRPGPLQSGMVEDFIDRKHGKKVVEYPHPCLEEVLKPTYGVIVYQEQVMQIAQKMAGYSLGEADMLRRAMGKKKPEEMAKQKSFFIEGSKNNGIDEAKAEEVFELVDYFSGYGFNKSHSAAYALISYQTAFLKSHYPSEFMAAVMSSDMDKTDKLVNYFADFETNGGKVVPPNINISDKMFLPTKKGNILFGLNAIKGVGATVCDEIKRARDEGGKFTDIYNFVERTSSKVNKTALTGLIKSGALDSFNVDRATLIENVEMLGKWRTRSKNMKEGTELERPELKNVPPINHKDKLDNEVLSMGVYLSGHPMDEYSEEMKSIPTCKNIDINVDEHGYTEKYKKHFSQIGVITNVERKKGMIFFTLDDTSGVIKCNMFKGVASKYSERINLGSVVMAKGRLVEDNYTEQPAITVNEILSVQEIREKNAKQVVIYDDNNILKEQDVANEVRHKVFENSPGYSKLFIIGKNEKCEEIQVDLKTSDSVVPNEAFIEYLNNKGLKTVIYYEGSELDFRSLKKTSQGEDRNYSKDEIVDKVKENMKRLKSLLDEAGVEKGDSVRKNSLKRSRDMSVR